MDPPAHVAFAAYGEPRDIGAWSGITYHMLEGLEGAGLRCTPVPVTSGLEVPLKGIQWLHNGISRRTYRCERERVLLGRYARQVRAALRRQPSIDAVFSPGSLPVSFLDTELPIAIWTDATFGALVDFYPQFSGLSSRALANGHRAEAACLARVSLAVFSSPWAAASATELYSVDPARVEVVPFGANVEAVSREALDELVDARWGSGPKLLLVGAEWERKGVDTAIATTSELRRRGTNAELVVAGAHPRRGGAFPDYVTVYPFLSKGDAEARRRLADLYRSACLFILPSRADCTPVVLSEAAAQGLPSVVSGVGGIPFVVRDGVTGVTLDAAATPSDYADAVESMLVSKARYAEIARNCLDEYGRRLNWPTTATRVASLMTSVLREEKESPQPSDARSDG